MRAGEALAAYTNSNPKSKGGDSGKGKKQRPKCFNCHRLGHKSPDCFAPGGGKEGQGPKQKGQKSGKQGDSNSANITNQSETMNTGETMFSFATTSSFHCVATKLGIPTERCSTIVNSGASQHYCPDKSKFKHFTPISDSIKLADGHTLPALGIGDVMINLPNGDKQNSVLLRKCVYALDMAFTLILIMHNLHRHLVTFTGNFCTIIMKIAHSDGLYQLSANVAITTWQCDVMQNSAK